MNLRALRAAKQDPGKCSHPMNHLPKVFHWCSERTVACWPPVWGVPMKPATLASSCMSSCSNDRVSPRALQTLQHSSERVSACALFDFVIRIQLINA